MHSHDQPLPRRPKRVLVAGVSGAGKTTLARRIAEITGGPHLEIDAIFHGPGWTPRPEFLADLCSFISADAWTTEWQYDAARPLLAERADLLVWLDFPFLRVTLPRVLKRTVHRRLRREELTATSRRRCGRSSPTVTTLSAGPSGRGGSTPS